MTSQDDNMNSWHVIYHNYLVNKTSPYYDWLKLVIKFLEQEKTQQDYVIFTTRSIVEGVGKTECDEKLTPRSLSKILTAALELNELKEGLGNDFFKSESKGREIYHVRPLVVIQSLKEI